MRTCRVVLAALAMLVLAPTTALASVNVGQSGWFWGNPLPQGNTINALDFAGARGYAVGAFGTILRSDDGGGTWSGLAGGTAVDLNLLQAVDTNTVIAGGRCTLRRSEDGGKTFARLPFTSSESSCSSTVSALWFTAPKTGYIVLADGTVLRTDDGGATFSRSDGDPRHPGDRRHRRARGHPLHRHRHRGRDHPRGRRRADLPHDRRRRVLDAGQERGLRPVRRHVRGR